MDDRKKIDIHYFLCNIRLVPLFSRILFVVGQFQGYENVVLPNLFLPSSQVLFFKIAKAFSRARKCFFACPLFLNR